MTKEEKELLLKDLCARARYRVKIYVPKGIHININGKTKEQDLVDTVYGVIFYNDEPKIVTPQNFSYLDKNGINNFGGWNVEMVKPYLRPMWSMTEEEREELSDYLCERVMSDKSGITFPPDPIHGKGIPFEWMSSCIDWLNKYHFDYRGLIPMGLAIEAPEDMYKL